MCSQDSRSDLGKTNIKKNSHTKKSLVFMSSWRKAESYGAITRDSHVEGGFKEQIRFKFMWMVSDRELANACQTEEMACAKARRFENCM